MKRSISPTNHWGKSLIGITPESEDKVQIGLFGGLRVV
jgi:hypothetical protein